MNAYLVGGGQWDGSKVSVHYRQEEVRMAVRMNPEIGVYDTRKYEDQVFLAKYEIYKYFTTLPRGDFIYVYKGEGT